MQTSNPVFSQTIFSDWAREETRSQVMTVQGTTSKTLLLMVALTATAGLTWYSAANGAAVMPFVFGGLIVGLIAAIATCFKPLWAVYLAPIYAAAEGVALGGISYYVETQFQNGIAFNAMVLTLGVLLVMLSLYTSRIIPVTDKLRTGIVAATVAVCLAYLVTWLLSMFGVPGVTAIHGTGTIGIAFSGIVVAIAAFNLLLDFDFIEQGARSGAPKTLEWYGAFGLLVTLVWLYISILRLLMKLQSRD